MKKIIRLTESQLSRVIKRIVEEVEDSETTNLSPDSYYLDLVRVLKTTLPKPGSGSKYCFSDKFLANSFKELGLHSKCKDDKCKKDVVTHLYRLYKIKSGDPVSKFDSDDDDLNDLCNLKTNPRKDDIIVYINLPNS